MNPDITTLIHFAMRDYESLALAEQIRLMRGIAAVCPEGTEEQETATQALFHLQRAQREQLQFRELLFPNKL